MEKTTPWLNEVAGEMGLLLESVTCPLCPKPDEDSEAFGGLFEVGAKVGQSGMDITVTCNLGHTMKWTDSRFT